MSRLSIYLLSEYLLSAYCLSSTGEQSGSSPDFMEV